MQQFKSAFTMIELIFVVVVIGILSAIALPKFAKTHHAAELSKGRADIASIRSGIMTERQSRVIKGVSNWIPTGTGTYTGSDGSTYKQLNDGGLFGGIFTYPITDSHTSGHWHKDSETATQAVYIYKMGSDDCKFTYTPADGKFTLDANQPAACSHLVD